MLAKIITLWKKKKDYWAISFCPPLRYTCSTICMPTVLKSHRYCMNFKANFTTEGFSSCFLYKIFYWYRHHHMIIQTRPDSFLYSDSFTSRDNRCIGFFGIWLAIIKSSKSSEYRHHHMIIQTQIVFCIQMIVSREPRQ